MDIDIDTLRELLDYDADTGKLYWKERSEEWFENSKNPTRTMKIWNKRYAGKEAFTAKHDYDYKMGRLSGKCYYAHIMIFMLHYGRPPNDKIMHINGIRDDNRIDNLKESNSGEIQKNQKKSKRNTSGYTGVRIYGLKYTASISVNRKYIHLGVFDTALEASKAYEEAKKQHGFSDRHGR